MQRGDDPLDVGIGCDNKMKAASDEVNARIDHSCSFNDFVDAGMGTANHDDQSFGGIDDQRKFAQFESTRLLGYECNQMDIRCDFSVLVHKLKIGTGPS